MQTSALLVVSIVNHVVTHHRYTLVSSVSR